MKKILKYIICGLIIVMIFTGCSKSEDNGNSDTSDTEVSDTTDSSASDETGDESSGENEDEHVHYSADIEDSDVSVDDAEISVSDAVEKIKSYSLEELGLDTEGEYDDYKFMASNTGKVIDDENYIEVIASVVTSENDDGTISMETMGTYFISYDGEKVFIMDNTTGEISEL